MTKKYMKRNLGSFVDFQQHPTRRKSQNLIIGMFNVQLLIWTQLGGIILPQIIHKDRYFLCQIHKKNIMMPKYINNLLIYVIKYPLTYWYMFLNMFCINGLWSGGHRFIVITNRHFIHTGLSFKTGVSIYLF